MKFLVVIAAAFLLTLNATAAEKKAHKVAENHNHKHGKKCGHKMEKHGDHVDYEEEVDGHTHHHKKHGKHYDECDGPEADAKK